MWDLGWFHFFLSLFFHCLVAHLYYFKQRGLSSLLRSKQVFNTHYLSAGIHYVQTETERQIKFSLSLVFDPPKKFSRSANFVRKIIGSLGIFPCKVADKSVAHYWSESEKAWKTIKSENINSLKIEDVISETPAAKDLVFTALKYMGGWL